jgi:peptidase M15-like protein
VITVTEYFAGIDTAYAKDLTDQIRYNATVTVASANVLLKAFGKDRSVTSGWRPPAVNAVTPHAAANSKHMTGQAVDLEDHDGALDEFCFENLLLEEIGLWQEHPASTKGWTHIQIAPYGSWIPGKRRWFYP